VYCILAFDYVIFKLPNKLTAVVTHSAGYNTFMHFNTAVTILFQLKTALFTLNFILNSKTWMVCIDVDVAQSVNGGPCFLSCSMLSVDIGIFITIVCHLFHCEQLSIFVYLCSYCMYITHGFL
jgi:hypothetical protein